MSSRFTATCIVPSFILFFFFNDTATTEIYTLSLHDALPISAYLRRKLFLQLSEFWKPPSPTAMLSQQFVQIYAPSFRAWPLDRKSTRLNSSHANISYAVFCLKKKKKT